MSQEKVERYKKEKANRKQTMKRQKIKRGITQFVVALIVIALLVWFGYSIWHGIRDKKESSENETITLSSEQYSSLMDMLNSSETNKGETTAADETEGAESTPKADETKDNKTEAEENTSKANQ